MDTKSTDSSSNSKPRSQSKPPKSQPKSQAEGPADVILKQISSLSDVVSKQNATLMGLPEAMTAQADTFQLMTNFLREMTQPLPNCEAQGSISDETAPSDAEIEPGMGILKAANDMIDQTKSDSEVEASSAEVMDVDELPEAVRNILNQTAPPTEYGDNLQAVVAESFSKMTNHHTNTLFEDLKLKYKTPANCKELGVAKVNPEIWAGLPHALKTRDARSQHLQQHLSRAMIAQAKASERVLDLISKTRNAELQSVLEALMDSSMSVGLAMRQINSNRKLSLKSSLLPEYSGLVGAQIPVTEYLFGDNLEASLKLVKSTSKIVRSSIPMTRYHPYGNRQFRPTTPNGNLNWRRQSFRSPQQMTGIPRPMNRQTYQPRFKKFQPHPRQ